MRCGSHEAERTVDPPRDLINASTWHPNTLLPDSLWEPFDSPTQRQQFQLSRLTERFTYGALTLRHVADFPETAETSFDTCHLTKPAQACTL